MRFAYRARDPMGRLVEGELEAPSPEAVQRELTGRALTTTWIRPVPGGGRGGAGSFSPSPVSQAELPQTPEPEELEDLTSAQGDDEDAQGQRRSGCSPWSVILLLLFLSQFLRAC